MQIEIIGCGFGRTGTLSLKAALEHLGIRPCHHMLSLSIHPDRADHWLRAGSDPESCVRALAGYAATTDWPGTYYWRELRALYPDARVILTVRDGESWYDSMAKTVIRSLREPDPGGPPAVYALARELILDATFGGRFDDRRHAIDVMERHNESVRDAVPPDRLLVFDVREGWAPLCAFLGRAVPDRPFPCLNRAENFIAQHWG